MRDFILGDCMDVMKDYPDGFFDLAVVDPPYGIGYAARKMHEKNGYKQYTRKEWDSAIPGEDYFRELFRVSKNQIIWGGNYFPLPPARCVIVWNKMQREFTSADLELAWTSFQNKVSRIFDYSRGELAHDKRTAFHPTYKPVALYKWIVKNYCKEGDLILDTHVGSASSLIAFEAAGLDYVGVEIDPEYHGKATARLNTERAKLDLFPPQIHKGGDREVPLFRIIEGGKA